MAQKFPVEKVRGYQFLSPPPLVEPNHIPDKFQRRLNLNECLHLPSPKAVEAMENAIGYANFYPDNSAFALTKLISERTKVPVENIRFGNGSSDLLLTIGKIAIEPGDEAVVPAPTFPMLGEGVIMAGGNLINIPVDAQGRNDIHSMLAALTPKTRIFYLCTPNNPTGGVISEADLKVAIREVPETCLMVFDEAYAEFAEHEGTADILKLLKKRRGQWIITRTFSKAYALAGLRIGYALTSDADLTRGLVQVSPSFVVSRVAMAAAEAAMRDRDYLTRTLETLVTERKRLSGVLAQMRCTILPSGANFITERPPRPARPIADRLAQDGILIQALPWPDANGALRITIGSREDIDAVIAALHPLLGNG
ncbi:MAG: aminotransferase class I/II-fold pyridoxal phosphate-dependent enzyme [Fimbriimonadaceae bacterium]|nr:aminotransferase class I/II-fold pyridoxal phosphate-dependent enzyme [Alphaproteobacteria bacterium]